MANERAAQLLADSRLAFSNHQNGTALMLARDAIKLEPQNADACKWAGNASMSLERYDEAINHYNHAVKYDPANGYRYYDLGLAQAAAERPADAIKSFARAEELGCTQENLIQLYNVPGIICFDLGKYDDALIYLKKSELLLGVNRDILQRRAVIYGLKNDILNGLYTANQIKMIASSDYIGYKIAFDLLLQTKRLDIAEEELIIAEKYANLTMDFYFDRITLEVEKYQINKDRTYFDKALSSIDKALKTLTPMPQQLVDTYINAAEIYLQLENANKTIDCLNAAQNPIGAFNNRFEIIDTVYEQVELSEYAIEDMIEEDKAKIADELGEYGLEELVASVEPDENGGHMYFLEISKDKKEAAPVIMLEETTVVLSADNFDQINRLYIGAYTLKKDFDKVIEYARKLQTSVRSHHTYIGKYTEANAMNELGLPDAKVKYEAIIKFFRNAMIQDPTDLDAITFCTQSYIDIGDFNEAEKMCNLLKKEIREPLRRKIQEANADG